nr:hypothetical protein [Candidatus Sigynarchaeota archaeon]
MGLDLDFIIKVCDSCFTLTIEQIENCLRLLDAYKITDNKYPSEAENALLFQAMRTNKQFKAQTSLENYVSGLKYGLTSRLTADDVIKNHDWMMALLRENGHSYTSAECWLKVQEYDYGPSTRQKYADEPNNCRVGRISCGMEPFFRVICEGHPTIVQRTQQDVKSRKSFKEKDMSLDYYYVPTGKGCLEIYPKDYGEGIGTRFFIYEEYAGRGLDDEFLDDFLAYFSQKYEQFLQDASRICNRRVKADVLSTC